jgi:hypothetical protein
MKATLTTGYRCLVILLFTFPGLAFSDSDDVPFPNSVGFTIGGNTNLDRDAAGWSLALDYARTLKGTQWYGSGLLTQIEYDQEFSPDKDSKTETISLYAGIYYDISSKNEIAFLIGQGFQERESGGNGWKQGGNTVLNAALGRDLDSPFGSVTLAVSTEFDIQASEWSLGASFSKLWDF